jgi:5-(carboxyamino)imidazole ribonucleotide mutase
MSGASIDVAIMMGSKSDLEVMRPAAKLLLGFGLAVEVRVLSAHRTPLETAAFVHDASGRGCKVFICAAGGAAHLAGAVAAHTTCPVVGVPIATGSLGGFDALLSTVMMPPGMPVATVAVGGAENAALLAAQIVALGDPALGAKVNAERAARRDKVIKSDQEVRTEFHND